MTPAQAIARKQEQDAVRHMIRMGRAEKMPNGDYRVVMPGMTHFYGAEYVERIMEFSKAEK